MSEKRSERSASLGSNSVKRTPGMHVPMVENGPRNSTGARGFGSNRSRWLGPPPSQISSTERALGPTSAARPPSGLDNPQANGSVAAACKNARLLSPWQSRVGKLPTDNMGLLSRTLDSQPRL